MRAGAENGWAWNREGRTFFLLFLPLLPREVGLELRAVLEVPIEDLSIYAACHDYVGILGVEGKGGDFKRARQNQDRVHCVNVLVVPDHDEIFMGLLVVDDSLIEGQILDECRADIATPVCEGSARRQAQRSG